MKRHRVFVSYFFKRREGNTGHGSTNLTYLNWKKRLSDKDVQEFRQHIIDTNNFEDVVILNYQIM